MLHLSSLDSLGSPERLKAFVQASAVADIFAGSAQFGAVARSAADSFSQQIIPLFGSIQEYGQFLKAAGLSTPRWPQRRLLTISEKRERLSHRINNARQSKPALRAWKVFERYELVLREIIDEAMTRRYGEDWPRQRLQSPELKSLLRRWEREGGDLFCHSDFAHYEKIMCDPEHFEEVFCKGFEDPEALRELLKKARKLRASVMHYHDFGLEDLRDVRLTWKAIEVGLVGLTDDFEYTLH